jgi:hypothetical protein
VADDTDIANRLRAAGLRVIEVAGWTTAGSSDFHPGGSVNHHTAGGASGATPSLSTCIYGRSDLPGPLCNTYQSRESDGDDIIYVVAAGRANHAGEGGWKGLSGNSSVYGLEIEHTGVDPLPMHRQKIAARCHAAMWTGSPSMVCQHREWTGRKIDAAEGVDANGFRQMVEDAQHPAPLPTPINYGGVNVFLAGQTSSGNWWLFEEDRRTLISDSTALYGASMGVPSLGSVNDTEFDRLIEDRKKVQ